MPRRANAIAALASHASSQPRMSPEAWVENARAGMRRSTINALPRPETVFLTESGPGVPMLPTPLDAARAGFRPPPRGFDYNPSHNLTGAPGTGRLIAFGTLREYGRKCAVARQCIELRKTERTTLEWDIRTDQYLVSRSEVKSWESRRREVRKLIARPDRNLPDLASWLRALFED